MQIMRDGALVAARVPVSLTVAAAIKDKTSGISWRCPNCGHEKFYTYGHPEISGFAYICCRACDDPTEVWKQIRQGCLPARVHAGAPSCGESKEVQGVFAMKTMASEAVTHPDGSLLHTDWAFYGGCHA